MLGSLSARDHCYVCYNESGFVSYDPVFDGIDATYIAEVTINGLSKRCWIHIFDSPFEIY